MANLDYTPELTRCAENLHLYSRRHRVIFALTAGEYDVALEMCREAMADCERIVFSKGIPDRVQHVRNLAELSQFEELLAACAAATAARASGTLAA